MNMMCNKCGSQIPDRSEFCLKCGSKVVPYTPQQPKNYVQENTMPENPVQQNIVPENTIPPKPKKKKTAFKIGVIAGILVIVGLIIALVFVLMNKDRTRTGARRIPK